MAESGGLPPTTTSRHIVLVFDNSYSKLRPKVCVYVVKCGEGINDSVSKQAAALSSNNSSSAETMLERESLAASSTSLNLQGEQTSSQYLSSAEECAETSAVNEAKSDI
jgi:hypothetical protein